MDDSPVIADSSFFICFLDDIKNPAGLISLLRHFTFLIPPVVYKEIAKSSSFMDIKSKNLKLIDLPYNFGEVLRPFFSKDENMKGEAQVIELAYILHPIRGLFRFILDDNQARRYVAANLKELLSIMAGTVGFIGICHCDVHILTKNYTLGLLDAIAKSSFRVTEEVLNNIKRKVAGCKVGT